MAERTRWIRRPHACTVFNPVDPSRSCDPVKNPIDLADSHRSLGPNAEDILEPPLSCPEPPLAPNSAPTTLPAARHRSLPATSRTPQPVNRPKQTPVPSSKTADYSLENGPPLPKECAGTTVHPTFQSTKRLESPPMTSRRSVTHDRVASFCPNLAAAKIATVPSAASRLSVLSKRP